MKLYSDRWKPQVRIEPATEDDPLVEVMDHRESEDEAPCTTVRVYFERERVDVEYTMQGCIEIRKLMNQSTPDDYREQDLRHMHFCSLPSFIEALQKAEKIAAEYWIPI